MVERIVGILSGFIIGLIGRFGYIGIVAAMAIDSACISLPSEIIMLFSGSLVSVGEMSLFQVALAGGLGM